MAQRQRGFTLIELMIVVSVIGMLAAMSVPVFRGYIQEARLNEAKPYLLEIASRMRVHKLRNGVYCCTGDTFDEAVMSTGLNVDLNPTGNFCFAVICRDAAICAGTTATNFIASSEVGDPTTEFEVWAILRNTTTATLTGPQTTTCKMPTAKLTPTGWVAASASGQAAREGRVVAYRYPPPPNGRDAAAGADSVFFTWVEGVSVSHALTP